MERGQFQIIGHRGARGLFPENTIAGFTRAWALGVRRFEIDIAVTRDDVPVLSHDAKLNPDITRTAGTWLAGPGPVIRSLLFAELAQYDVGAIRPGTAYAARFLAQQPLDQAPIPRLSEVLEAMPEAIFTIELKSYPDHPEYTAEPEHIVDLVMAAVTAAGAANRVRLQSFDWRGPRYLGRIHPEIARAWLTEPKTIANPKLWWGVPLVGTVAAAVAAEGGDTWAPDHDSLTEEAIRRARALGLAVVPWTVNEPGAAARFAAWGAVGVITDRPDLLLPADRRA